MKNLKELKKESIIKLYEEGLNCVQIKLKLGLKGHQEVLNVLKKYPGYVPYRNGRGNKRKYTLQENFFETIDSEEKAYILGLICADGYIDTKNKRVKFILASKDVDILEKMKIALGSNALIKNLVVENRFGYGTKILYHSKIEFCSTKMTNDLVKIGLKSDKTYSLNSSVIKFVPESLIRHFLRGYFDGDGNVFYGVKYNSGTKYNINIAGNLEFLENTYGKYFPTVNKYYFFKKSKQCYAYKLSSKSNVDFFLDYIYKDSKIFLERKYKIYLQSKAAHVKQGELLGSPITVGEDNQHPSLNSNVFEGSTTNNRVLPSKVEDSNVNTSALPVVIERDIKGNPLVSISFKIIDYGEDIV